MTMAPRKPRTAFKLVTTASGDNRSGNCHMVDRVTATKDCDDLFRKSLQEALQQDHGAFMSVLGDVVNTREVPVRKQVRKELRHLLKLPDRALLGTNEVAALLGITPWTLLLWVKQHKFPRGVHLTDTSPPRWPLQVVE